MLPDIDPPFPDDDLEAYFECWEAEGVGAEGVPIPMNVTAWTVCDTGTAEWALRRLASAEARTAEVKADAERFRPHQRAVNYFAGRLTDYARRKREEDGTKTLSLPSGKVTSRLNPARHDIPKESKAEFVEWAKARELPVVKAKWEPVMDEVKKAVVFRTVCFPRFVGHGDQVYDAGDHLLVVPSTLSVPIEEWLEALGGSIENLLGPAGNLEERPSTAIYRRDDGSWWLVPGVVEVPAEVRYTVVPDLP